MSARLRRAQKLAHRHNVELAWAAFAAANYAAMITWPSWETIPFHFVWISLTLLYGFRVWAPRPTLIVLACVMTLTGVSIGFDAFHGIQLWGELFEVPLMAAMFLAMVWHARRRVDAQRIAEGRADKHRLLLESQERFIHDASHELRTPVTIARGHLELLVYRVRPGPRGRRGARRAGADGRDRRPPSDVGGRQRARLPPARRDRARAPARGRVHAVVGAGATGLAARPTGRRPSTRRRRASARCAGRAAGERGQVLVARSGDRAARSSVRAR